jgi:uncharacterized protein
MTTQKVLITGASGLIGSELTKKLLGQGYEVAWLSRGSETAPGVRTYRWDVRNNNIEEGALDGAAFIIHLAGAGIADERWSAARKKVILESRRQTTKLLAKEIARLAVKPRAFITASGSGYYGADTGNRHNIEESPAGGDFIGNVVVEWEKQADQIAGMGIRTVKLRTGIVLSADGGALQKMAFPARWGLGTPLGRGTQWVSWIHIDDLCNLYLYAMENDSLRGSYNAVAPQPVTNADLMKKVCKVLGRPFWLPAVPGFMLRALLGEMAALLLGSNYVVNWRLTKETSFAYRFKNIENALSESLGR